MKQSALSFSNCLLYDVMTNNHRLVKLSRRLCSWLLASSFLAFDGWPHTCLGKRCLYGNQEPEQMPGSRAEQWQRHECHAKPELMHPGPCMSPHCARYRTSIDSAETSHKHQHAQHTCRVEEEIDSASLLARSDKKTGTAARPRDRFGPARLNTVFEVPRPSCYNRVVALAGRK
jgi:hypothetical protein